MFKKIFLSVIIFLLILFLQIVFTEKNFAEENEKKSVKIYNIVKCEKDIENEMKKIAWKNREAYYKNMEKICKKWDDSCLTLSEKWEIISYNFRVLSCNFEAICWWLKNFMFFWKDWKKEWLENDEEISFWWWFVTLSCPEIKFDKNIFQYCDTKESTDFIKITRFCEDTKNNILYWDWKNWKENWNYWEYWFIKHNFEIDAKKDKINFLSSRIYDLNLKMKELAWNMNDLKVQIVDIVNKIVCTVK